jgi:acetoacetyl-CoA synthetase
MFGDLWDGAAIPPKDFVSERVGHDHPLWILFSSGTTALPKAIVHSHVGMLITLWSLAAETGATVFGTSPTYMRSMEKLGIEPRNRYDLSALGMILLSGSPAKPETLSWFDAAVKRDLWIPSTSGGADICAAIVAPLPTLFAFGRIGPGVSAKEAGGVDRNLHRD